MVDIFNYSQWLFDEIAQTISADIVRALKPKPAKIHENYWTIEVWKCPGLYYTMGQGGWTEFSSYEEVEEYLLRPPTLLKLNLNTRMVDSSEMKMI